MFGFDAHHLPSALLWTQVLLIWAVANYLPNNDPAGHQELEAAREQRLLLPWKRQVWVRALAAACVTALLPGTAGVSLIGRMGLAVLVLAGSTLLPLMRLHLAERRSRHRRQSPGIASLHVQRGVWLAEWEVGMNALVAGASWLLITGTGASIRPWIHLPVETSRVASLSGSLAVALIATRGGAFVVRGVLNKVGALPLIGRRPEEQIDLVEFNRGRIIGLLERFIVLLLMALQAYAAIAFLMAAKGLIRSKELESRDFAEYFLIGTLASMSLALVAGIAVQWFLRASS